MGGTGDFSWDNTVNNKQLAIQGNVMLNSTTPGSPRTLIIKGNENANSSSAGNIEFLNTTNSYKLAKISAGTSTQTNDGVLKFYTKASWNGDLVEQMRIDEFGRIGINGVPTQTLHIHQVYPVLLLDETDASANEKKWFIEANSGVFKLRALNDAENAGTDFFKVTRSGHTVGNVTFPTGNVGIATDSPVAKFQVGDQWGISRVNAGSYELWWDKNETAPRVKIDQSLAGGPATGIPGIGFCGGGSIATQGAAIGQGVDDTQRHSRTLGLYTSNGTKLVERVRVDGAGLVGIGTAPDTILHIKSATPNLKLESTTTEAQLVLKTTGDQWYIQADDSSGDLEFIAQGVGTPMSIDHASGNIGIGGTPSTYRMDMTYTGNNGLRLNDGTRQLYLGTTGGEGAIGTLTNHQVGVMTNGANRMTIAATGNVTIAKTTATDDYELTVTGKIRTEEVVVETIGADFVFEEDYKLPSLADVEKHVTTKKHLPGIAPAAEMQKNGMDLSKQVTKHLQKIEELTLYTIDLNKKVEAGERFKTEALKELEESRKSQVEAMKAVETVKAENEAKTKEIDELTRRLERIEKLLERR